MVMPRSRSRSISSRNWDSISPARVMAPGAFEEAVGEGGLAVVDVGDDADVADLDVVGLGVPFGFGG